MKKSVKIEQQSSYDCGAACLCSVAAWHGLFISLAKARHICGCSKDGITIKGLMEGGRELGFECQAYRATDKNDNTIFEKIPLPAIAHMKKDYGFFHFITIYKTDNNNIIIMDPALGKMDKIPYNIFLKEWTGYIILLEPGKQFKKGNKKTDVYRQFLKMIGNHCPEMVCAILCSITILFSGIAGSIFMQQIIDVAIPAKDHNMLIKISLLMAIITLAGLFANYAKGICMAKLGMKMDKHLISSYLNKIMVLPPYFFQQYQPGDINARIGDAFNIRLFISEGIISIIMSIAIIAVSIPVMFHYNSTLAILSASFIPFYIGLYILSGFINKKYNGDIAVTGARFESDVLQSIRNIASIRLYDAGNLFMEKMEKGYEELTSKLYKSAKACTGFGSAAETISKGMLATILVTGAFAVFNNGITVGEFISFYTLSTFLCTPLLNLANMNPMITQAIVSAERLFEIMDLPSCVSEQDTPSPNQYSISETQMDCTKKKDIIIRNLNYTYPGRDYIIKNLSLTIEQGKITLITGKIGSGKSTLVSLLMRYYQADNNTIFCGDMDINGIDINEWRKFISIVPQKFEIFNASILDNITCGNSDADPEKVMKVCNSVGISDDIAKMPAGIFTHIGEHGVALSGGQCQKIAIARVLYREPETIILDEATSFMDEESERAIMRLMQHLRDQGKSIIIISHNSCFKTFADKIASIS